MTQKIKRDIIINSTNEETRIALCEDDKLADVFIEQPDNERMIGDIYKGRVGKIATGMQALFVDIGMTNDAFMHFSEFEHTYDDMMNDDDDDDDDHSDGKPRQKRGGSRRVDPTKLVKTGDELLVQIIKEPIANKGCRITTKISLAGRFVVLLPNERNIGVSKKIPNRKERHRLRQIARDLLPEGHGIIIRTTCDGKPEAILKRDIKNLLKKWADIEKKAKANDAPFCVHNDYSMTNSIMRDLFSDDINSVVVDTRREYKTLRLYIKDVAPELSEKLIYHKSHTPVFDEYYNIEKDLQRSLEKKVWLKNGGYLFIEHTEAFTSIDINSGRFMGKKGQDENALKVNLDAAREIARQIRLRDIGGLIIIDFIDTVNEEFRKRVHTELLKSFKSDKAVYNIAEMSRFCLIEMTRQRIRPSVVHAVTDTCPRCKGVGLIPSKETIVSRLERFIKRYRAVGYGRRISIRLHPDMYKFMTEDKNARVKRMMWKYWMIIKVEEDTNLLPEKYVPVDPKGKQIVLKN
jgi:ribonuclease G